MNLDQLLAKTEGLAKALSGELRKEVEMVAQDGLVMVTQRISETGKNANGQAFPPYTKPYERFKRGAVGTARKEGKKRRAARQTAQATASKPVGRFRGFVDFTLTGQMLSSIGLVETTADRGRIVVRVTGRDAHTLDKMEGNENYRPGWFRISEKEVKTLAEQSQERLSAFAQRFLNS